MDTTEQRLAALERQVAALQQRTDIHDHDARDTRAILAVVAQRTAETQQIMGDQSTGLALRFDAIDAALNDISSTLQTLARATNRTQ